MTGAVRYLTILWPGLPWLWLRGSLAGLVLALAFALTLDLALVSTWIWSELFGLPFTIAVWTATALIWLLATVSAAAAFPPSIPRIDPTRVDPLLVEARDAYLARDWIRAETRIRELLAIAPTDGEAQLLLATLLRRVGRRVESRAALAKLSSSDVGDRWSVEIAAELARLEAPPAVDAEDAVSPAADPPEDGIAGRLDDRAAQPRRHAA